MGKSTVSMIAAVFLVSLISGCTIHLVPNKIPPLDPKTEGIAGPFRNITVTLINAQSDDANYSVKDLKGKDTGYELSRKVWTEKLAEALGAEFTARQGKVVENASMTISLTITDVVYEMKTVGALWNIQFDATARVALNSGWTKTYVGKGDSAAAVPAGFGGDSNWNRAAIWTIRDVLLAIMSDPEFVAKLRNKK